MSNVGEKMPFSGHCIAITVFILLELWIPPLFPSIIDWGEAYTVLALPAGILTIGRL